MHTPHPHTYTCQSALYINVKTHIFHPWCQCLACPWRLPSFTLGAVGDVTDMRRPEDANLLTKHQCLFPKFMVILKSMPPAANLTATVRESVFTSHSVSHDFFLRSKDYCLNCLCLHSILFYTRTKSEAEMSTCWVHQQNDVSFLYVPGRESVNFQNASILSSNSLSRRKTLEVHSVKKWSIWNHREACCKWWGRTPGHIIYYVYKNKNSEEHNILVTI